MSSRSRIALVAAALVLLAGAAVVAIWIATEPGRAPGAGAGAASAGDPSLAADAAALPSTAAAGTLPPLPGPAATPSPEWRKANPTVPAPVPNETPPVAGPPPRGLPSDPAAREDAILDVRRKRFADQMRQLNRRAVQRGGVPADAGARPPPAQPGPGDRRSGLAGDR